MLDIIVDPFITILLVLYGLLGQNVVLAIVAFTALVRFAMLPLTIKQQRSFKRMQELSPKLRQLQEKYKNDRERLAQEQMALYREHGVNPFAGCLPLLIQLPIFIGLWRAIIATLASTPDAMLDLNGRVLVGGLDHLVPLHNTFLWMNLALPDPFYVLPILVVITTYLQQKLIMPVAPTSPSGDKNDPAEQAARMSRQMTTFMPLLFGFLALTYSSGLSIYFITSNIIGVIQYALMGKADFRRLIGKESPKKETPTKEVVLPASAVKEQKEPKEEAPSKPAKPEKVTAEAAASPATVTEVVAEPVKSIPGRTRKPGISDVRLTSSSSSASGGSSGRRPPRQPAKSGGSRSRSKR